MLHTNKRSTYYIRARESYIAAYIIYYQSKYHQKLGYNYSYARLFYIHSSYLLFVHMYTYTIHVNLCAGICTYVASELNIVMYVYQYVYSSTVYLCRCL